MSVAKYRYPFTPYPQSWYFVADLASRHRTATVCGQELTASEHGVIDTVSGAALPHFLIGTRVFAFMGAKTPLFAPALVPAVKEFNDPKWLKPFHLRFVAKTHIQEVAENAVDLAHFSRVHAYQGEPELTGLSLAGPTFSISMRAERRIFGITDKPFMTITYYGLGVVMAEVKSKSVQLKVLLTNTPISPHEVVIHHWIAIRKSSLPKDILHRLTLPYIVHEEFGNDLPVWQHKIYLSKPQLCPEERNILRIRNWAKQFY